MARIGIRGRVIDLYVRFVDAIGNHSNADDTPLVSVYDSNGTLVQAKTNYGVSLVDEPGLYKFSYTIPETSTVDGYWSDRWEAEIGNETVTNSFYFQVISSGTIEEDAEPNHTPGDDVDWDFNKEEVYGINILLKMLKPRVKNDGVRKIPDGSGGYTEVKCVVFDDDELISFLVNSLSNFNQYPHFTNYKFSDQQTYTIFSEIIVQGAVLLALAAQSLIEKGREFSITDNGVQFTSPQISELLNSQYGAQLADYKEKLKIIKFNLKPAALALGTFRTTANSPAYLRLRHLRERRII